MFTGPSMPFHPTSAEHPTQQPQKTPDSPPQQAPSQDGRVGRAQGRAQLSHGGPTQWLHPQATCTNHSPELNPEPPKKLTELPQALLYMEC
eukprot:2780255-Alexandrium_andersonii.AAC.1